MKTKLSWKGKLSFEAEFGNHRVPMDAQRPLGDDSAASPKQLALAGLAGCTSMDVISLLRKERQEVTAFHLEVDAPTREEHPTVFTEVRLTYQLEGKIDSQKALEAAHLSQSLYCGVSAMVSKACPILYTVEINGKKVGEGKAEFKF